MSVGLLGKKIGMTQVYGDDGVIVPVTVIEAGPCVVLQVRTQSRDGYDAVQLGFDDAPREKVSRSVRGHVAAIGGVRQSALKAAGVEVLPKAECEPKRFVREFRLVSPAELSVGQVLLADSLSDVQWVDVIGVSKGRGTTGVMKRHNFAGQPASHGAKRVHRHPGSIGQSADPSKVMKGTKMAGRFGGERVTVKNLRVVRVDAESNLLLVRGAIPGPQGSFVVVRRSEKNA
ncbi:MAG: 50S ribosomal protein L3 [Planctomycetaceae bacterium]|nr:50S ribosomal protein L3 [Planctomycetaceae bacterium]